MAKGKSSNGRESKLGEDLPALVDPRLAKALGNVLRQHILLATVQGEVSPSEISKALGERLSQVSYHVNVLRDDCDGMIEETRTRQRRGALQHYYRATAKSLLPAKAWRRLKKELRAVVGAGQASDLFNDLAEALEAGKLQGPHDHIVRMPLALDHEGERNVKAIAERATREVENEQRASAERNEEANGSAGTVNGYTFALFAFEAAWGPADALTVEPERASAKSKSAANGSGSNGGGKKRGSRKAKAAGS